ncbi:MAG: hypothetical protein RL748_1771 [Pseudomonadota bacterium]|jgi:hypothetical protein
MTLLQWRRGARHNAPVWRTRRARSGCDTERASANGAISTKWRVMLSAAGTYPATTAPLPREALIGFTCSCLPRTRLDDCDFRSTEQDWLCGWGDLGVLEPTLAAAQPLAHELACCWCVSPTAMRQCQSQKPAAAPYDLVAQPRTATLGQLRHAALAKLSNALPCCWLWR